MMQLTITLLLLNVMNAQLSVDFLHLYFETLK